MEISTWVMNQGHGRRGLMTGNGIVLIYPMIAVQYPLTGDIPVEPVFTWGNWFYRKVFYLGEELKGKRIYLKFDGVYKNSMVWRNSYYL